MSLDFDLAPAPTGAEPGPAAPQMAPLSLPTQPTPLTVAKTPAPAPEEPAGTLTAFFVTGGPAVALIVGCWLFHEFGPWIVLGALFLAAAAAFVAVRMWWRKTLIKAGQKTPRTPVRAGPSPSRLRRILGRDTGSPSATPRSGRTNTSGTGSSGGRPGSGGKKPGGGSGSWGSAARTARRNAILGSGGGTSRTNNGGGRKLQRGLNDQQKRRDTKTPGTGGGTSRTPAAFTKTPNKSSGAKPHSVGGGTGASSTRGSGGAGHRKTGKGGLFRRATGGLGGGKTKRTNTHGSKGSSNKTSGTGPATNRPGTTPQPGGGKKKTPNRNSKTPPAGGRTTSGRRKVRITPGQASRAAGKLRKLTSRKHQPPIPAKKPTPATSPAVKAQKRRLARIANRRRAARLKNTGRRLWKTGKRGACAGNTLAAPFIARGFLTTGRALGWAQRHMLRIANSADSPNWAPGIARTVAGGIGMLMNAGLWVSRRRRVQSWLLRHYATTGGNPAAAAVRAAHILTTPTTEKTTQATKPGPAVHITTPTSPTLTTRTGDTVAATPDDIADAFDQFLSQFEPESVPDLSAHFDAFAPMLERFCAATANHAQRLQDEYGVRGGVIDMLQQFGAAFGGMHDLAEEVVSSWQSEHADDIDRHENPRPHEEDVWNYKPGA